jgi:hypothetical protein
MLTLLCCGRTATDCARACGAAGQRWRRPKNEGSARGGRLRPEEEDLVHKDKKSPGQRGCSFMEMWVHLIIIGTKDSSSEDM